MTTWTDHVHEEAERARTEAVNAYGHFLCERHYDLMLDILASTANRIMRARRLEALGVECP